MKLVSKVIWGGLAMFILIAVVSGLGDKTPSTVKNVNTELFVEYNDKIYTPSCKTKEFKEEWFVFCSSSDNRVAGGVFWVELFGDEGGSYRLWAINGKAKQHADKMGITYMPYYLNSSESIDDKTVDEAVEYFMKSLEG